MAYFPNTEPEIVSLANVMIAGCNEHPEDFPSITVADLQTALTNYQSQHQQQEDAKSQAQIATVTKDDALQELVSAMKNDLKLAEVDTADDPEKLTEIGWAAKSGPTPIILPKAPTNLKSVYEGAGTLELQWEKPVHSAHRPVSNFIVQRRDQQQPDSGFTEWKLVDMSYQPHINLLGQPRGIQLEYRVIATNAAGESSPSNTASVVL